MVLMHPTDSEIYSLLSFDPEVNRHLLYPFLDIHTLPDVFKSSMSIIRLYHADIMLTAETPT